MSWSDPSRRFEPAEDQALRAELSDLLGLAPRKHAPAEPTPELTLLAEELRKEALRRRHTERRKPSWGLLTAAVLPLMAGMGALGFWGHQQHQKAEALASQAQRVNELERVAQARHLALQKERAAHEQTHQELVRVAAQSGRKVPQLVIPAEDPIILPGAQQERVKAPGQ